VQENQVYTRRRLGKLSEVKLRDFEVRRTSSISKNRGCKVISEVKWGEDQLNAVKGRE